MRRRADLEGVPAYDPQRWPSVDAWYDDALPRCETVADVHALFDAWCELQPVEPDPRIEEVAR